MKKAKIKKVPFEFVFELLEGLSYHTKPMFGCLGVYVDSKICLILRERGDADDGVWLATSGEHHESLQEIFPSMRSIYVFGPGKTSWQVLPASAADFESSVDRACEMVRKGDPRIGKIPKSKAGPSSKRRN